MFKTPAAGSFGDLIFEKLFWILYLYCYYSGAHSFRQIMVLAKTQGTQSFKPARLEKIINDFSITFLQIICSYTTLYLSDKHLIDEKFWF
jgi:hypothetical protein